jgi:hypothetical protein
MQQGAKPLDDGATSSPMAPGGSALPEAQPDMQQPDMEQPDMEQPGMTPPETLPPSDSQ